MRSTNVVWNGGHVSKEERSKLIGHPNKVVWLTGLSGSGKSTLARQLEKKIHDLGLWVYVLDGDNVRHGLNSDLGFSAADREENIRRISEVARLFYDAGAIIIVSFISPYQKDRDFGRSLIGNDFCEVFVDCPIDICAERDPKGLYEKAKAGLIKNFTGISDPYEAPLNPEVHLKTNELSPDECVDQILEKLGLLVVAREHDTEKHSEY